MSWITHRNNTIVLTVVTAAFLFGIISALGFGLDINSNVAGISIGALLGAGQVYILWTMWKRYL